MKIKYLVLVICILFILVGIFGYVLYGNKPIKTVSIATNPVQLSSFNGSYKGVSYAPDLSDAKGGDLTYGGRINLSDPSFATVHLRYVWGQLNPSKGVYDFRNLDAALDQIAQAGKKATIVVSAGKWTPGWVFENGAHHFSIPIATSKVNKDNYAQQYIPLVWDEVYLREYSSMITALANHLHTNAIRYDTVALVKISGINIASAEMRLTQEKVFSQSDEELCPVWAKDGYTEEKVINAAKTLAKNISDAFPDKELGLAFVIGGDRFPAVINGICDGIHKNNTIDTIIRILQTTYGKRLVTDSTVFTWETGNPAVFEEFEANGTPVAFQFKSQALGCKDFDVDSDTPATTGPLTDDDVCTRPEFQATVDRAIKYKSTFIEVFPNDIIYFNDILRAANKTLQSL